MTTTKSTLSNQRGTPARLPGLMLFVFMVMASSAWGQLPIPASTQFDITGFIQEATLDPSCVADPHCGGTIKLNGHVVVVPRETIVILPANALTWQEIFAQAPAPYGFATNPPSSGMALADLPAPMTTYEAQVVGNRVITGGNDRYIAGLIYISQHALNSGNGFINYIDYTLGEIRVGGILGDNTTGARVRINDPVGRYGRVMSPDIRFTVDPDNPTIASATGFPMCLPRVTADPAIAGNPDDPLCPRTQRPVDVLGNPVTVIQTNDPVALPGVPPDATIQIPFKIGDWVNFAGTLVNDSATPTAGPWPGTAGTYISAHTISNNVAVYTWPGTFPAYVSTEVTIIGTGGLIVLGAGEAVIRTRFEGMATDYTHNIHLYGIDFDPLTGAPTDRDFGAIGVDPGPPVGANRGRWRFRPPCLAFGSTPTDKDCVMNAAGTFLPPPREVRAVIEGLWVPGQTTTFANGIIAGQYHAPILEYIFPENIPGAPIPENNFNTIPFLAQGGYTSSAGTLVGQLNPWPSDLVPTPACAAPVANAGGPYTAGSGATIALSGSATGTAPITYAWTATAGAFSDATLAATNYIAPQTAAAITASVSLTATNSCGSSTSTTTVDISAALAPTVDPIASQSVTSGNAGGFAVTGSDPNVPASVPLAWSISQSGSVALLNLAIASTGSTSASVTYTAPSGITTATDVTVTVTAANAAGVASAPVSTIVTVNPAVAGCDAPVANAGGPYTAGAGGSISLGGSATGTAPITFAWATPSQGTINPLDSPTATYTAPVVLTQTVVNLSLTASNACGTSTATSTVTVNAALAPVVNHVAPMSVFSGATASFPVSGSDPNVPALLPLSWAVSQTGTPALINLAITPSGSTTASLTFTAPTLPLGQVTSSVIQLTITDTNTAPLASAPEFTSVTVNPLPDAISVTSAEYRTTKQRLIINATSSVVSPNVVLKLQPYVCETASACPPSGVYNPDPAAGGLGNVFTNNGGGLYLLDISGAPRPACGNAAGYQTPCPATPIDVKSNLNGDSGFVALTRIRQ